MKKILKLLLAICVAIATVSFAIGCTGVLEPLNNSETFTHAERRDWLSGENLVAGQYEEFEIESLNVGLEPGRISDIRLWFDRRHTLNYEFGEIKFTISADRDVSLKLTVASGIGDVADYDVVLVEKEVELVKDKAVEIDFDFATNVFIRPESSPDYITISFRTNKELDAEDVESWLATSYVVSAFEIYGGESSH